MGEVGSRQQKKYVQEHHQKESHENANFKPHAQSQKRQTFKKVSCKGIIKGNK
jgi:hypothetical protein